jgi:hypothetical protein
MPITIMASGNQKHRLLNAVGQDSILCWFVGFGANTEFDAKTVENHP